MSNFWQDPKSAVNTALVTIGASITYTLGIIPDDIVKLSALLGSIVLAIQLYNHIRSKSLDEKYIKAEVQIARLEKLQRELTQVAAKNEALLEILGHVTINNPSKAGVQS